ncbi:MAG: glycosyltransferase family 39 protein [Cyanobacteria bacterium J06628_6]
MKSFDKLSFESGLLLSILAMAGLRFLLLGQHELWYDEALSLLLSSGKKGAYTAPGIVPMAVKEYSMLLAVPVGSLAEAIEKVLKGIVGDVHPPLFYLSQHFWMRLFGASEVAQRSLVALTGLGTIGAAYGLGRTAINSRGGLILAALVAFNPFLLSHALNLRMYTLLVLWTLLSQWALVVLIRGDQERHWQKRQRLWLMAAVAVTVAGGLLTQYLFVYTLASLAILVLAVGRRHWLQYGLTLAAGVVLMLPWALWGTRQQIRNRGGALSQVSAEGNPVGRHLQDILQTLADHLVLGRWTAGFEPIASDIKPAAVIVGLFVVMFLGVCALGLYSRGRYRLLLTSVILGLGPLLIAWGLDIFSNSYTVGFGWGRTTIMAVPGCLLLITGWVTSLSRRWQGRAISGLLALYFAVGVGDQVLRERDAFRTVSEWVEQAPSRSTLIAMNSRAWGNVSKLAYYVNGELPVDMLATNPVELAGAVDTALAKTAYDRVLWLNTPFPVWKTPKTLEAAEAYQQSVSRALANRYESVQETTTQGTMKLDRFTLRLYEAR